MDKFMTKFFKENYNNEQIEKINKLDKMLTEVYIDIFNKRKNNIFEEHKNIKKKLEVDEIEDLYNKLDEMYYLSSFLSKEEIIEIILKCEGDEDKIHLELERIL